MTRLYTLLGWVALFWSWEGYAEARQAHNHAMLTTFSSSPWEQGLYSGGRGWANVDAPKPQSTPTPFLTLRGGSSPYRPAPRILRNPLHKGSSTKRRFGRQPPQEQHEFTKNDDVDDDTFPTTAEDKAKTKEMIDAFLTRDSRNTFIARVYAILSGQLLVTAAVCILFGLYAPLASITSQINPATGQYHPLMFAPLGGILLSTIAWFRMAAVPQARQKSPNKWSWLVAFTIGEALSLGSLSSLYKMQSVLLAMGATAVATISVSAYTVMQKNAKYDLSQWGATLSSWAMILLVYLVVGLVQEVGWLPFQVVPYSDMMYSAFAAFLFSIFLAHHTKLIVGGKHAKYRMNEKDYVFGAMTLYVDIVNIFLNILQLIGEDRN